MMENGRILTLHFIDGSKVSFDFPEQTSNTLAKKIKLDEFIKNDHLTIEADGTLMVFPKVNIKYLQVTIAGRSVEEEALLPSYVIRGAHIVS